MTLTTISRFIKVIVSRNIFSKTWLQFMCASSHHVCSHWFQTQVIDDRHLNYINEFCALAWIAWKRKHTGAQIFWNTILLPILLIHTYRERERESISKKWLVWPMTIGQDIKHFLLWWKRWDAIMTYDLKICHKNNKVRPFHMVYL